MNIFVNSCDDLSVTWVDWNPCENITHEIGVSVVNYLRLIFCVNMQINSLRLWDYKKQVSEINLMIWRCCRSIIIGHQKFWDFDQNRFWIHIDQFPTDFGARELYFYLHQKDYLMQITLHSNEESRTFIN